MVIGKDATESFEDVGHSDEAREILKTLFIGTFGELDVCPFPHMNPWQCADRTPYAPPPALTHETRTETPGQQTEAESKRKGNKGRTIEARQPWWTGVRSHALSNTK